MFLNFLFAVVLLAVFDLSIALQIRSTKSPVKHPLSYYLIATIPQSIFLLIILILFMAYGNGSIAHLALGVLVYAVGFFTRLKTFGDLKNNYNVSKEKMSDRIITSGIYSYARHPLYLGTLLVYLGFCLMIFSKEGIILYFIFLVPLFLIRIREEEKEFAGNAEYQEYKKRTSQLIPFVY